MLGVKRTQGIDHSASLFIRLHSLFANFLFLSNPVSWVEYTLTNRQGFLGWRVLSFRFLVSVKVVGSVVVVFQKFVLFSSGCLSLGWEVVPMYFSLAQLQ